jgi:NAD(P)-dependent dehydrogenase (short-subunit alcohol dehydrogenase family)
MLLTNRVAVVTGGARGIGQAICFKFVNEGCKVVVADIRSSDASDTINQITKMGGEGLYVNCDVSNGLQVSNLIDTALKRFGQIDILVNNAAISPPENSISDITEEEWDKVLSVNLKSAFLCCKAVVPHMKKRKYGKIINVSSLGAISPAPFMADYAAAKAGVVALSQSLAMELAPFSINVNSLLPGITRTALHDTVIPEGMSKEEHFARAERMIPLRKVANPEDIAGVALFLASDLSNYVTGDRILVAGGLR